jgi:hypothetical protein
VRLEPGRKVGSERRRRWRGQGVCAVVGQEGNLFCYIPDEAACFFRWRALPVLHGNVDERGGGSHHLCYSMRF